MAPKNLPSVAVVMASAASIQMPNVTSLRKEASSCRGFFSHSAVPFGEISTLGPRPHKSLLLLLRALWDVEQGTRRPRRTREAYIPSAEVWFDRYPRPSLFLRRACPATDSVCYFCRISSRSFASSSHLYLSLTSNVSHIPCRLVVLWSVPIPYLTVLAPDVHFRHKPGSWISLHGKILLLLLCSSFSRSIPSRRVAVATVVTASIVSSSPNLVTLMMEALRSSESPLGVSSQKIASFLLFTCHKNLPYSTPTLSPLTCQDPQFRDGIHFHLRISRYVSLSLPVVRNRR
jgi:hypothetical protein